MRARARRIWAGLVTLVLVAAFCPGMQVGARAEAPAGLRLVTSWRLDDERLANGRIVIDPVGRRIFVVAQAAIGVFDADTLHPLAPVVPFTSAWASTNTNSITGLSTPIAFGFDPALDAVVIGWEDPASPGLPRLTAIGLRGAALAEVGSIDLSTDLPKGSTVVGLTRVPGSPWIYALSAQFDGPNNVAGSVPGTTALTQLDLRDFLGPRRPGEWTTYLPRCLQPAGSASAVLPITTIGYVPSPPSLFFGCARPENIFFVDPPVPEGIARVVLDPAPTADSPQPPSGMDLFTSRNAWIANSVSAFDRQAGRFLVSTNIQSNSGLNLFDARSTAWFGQQGFGGGSVYAIDVDQATGRVYTAAQHDFAVGGAGIFVTDARVPAAQQGSFFKLPSGAINSIAVDSTTRRVYVMRTKLNDDPVSVFVLQDDVPPFHLDSDDPDQATSDVAEARGITDATFNGAAQGFGALIRSEDVFDVQRNAVTADAHTSNGVRELRGAWVDRLSVDPNVAATSVVEVDRDPDTRQNESQLPFSVPLPDPVACADNAGKPQDAGSPAGTWVSCNLQGASVQAVVRAGAISSDGVSIANSSTMATAQRSPVEGMHVHVVSTAEGIRLIAPGGFEVLSIGSVTATSDAWAHGRPGTARTTYSGPVMKKVVVQGHELCDQQCDVGAVAATVNQQLSGSLRITFPGPDPEAAAGTPKGYDAEVRRDRYQHVEDTELNVQPDDRVEVPAVEIVLSADDTRAWRTIVRLAGTEAEARYGVYRLGDDGTDGSVVDAGPIGSADSGLVGGVLSASPVAEMFPDLQPASKTSGLGALGQLVRILRNPLRLLWNGDPTATAVLWALLLLPVYLSARRALLLRRAVRLGIGGP